MAKLHAKTEFEKYRIIQDRIYISDFDQLIIDSEKLKKDKGFCSHNALLQRRKDI